MQPSSSCLIASALAKHNPTTMGPGSTTMNTLLEQRVETLCALNPEQQQSPEQLLTICKAVFCSDNNDGVDGQHTTNTTLSGLYDLGRHYLNVTRSDDDDGGWSSDNSNISKAVVTSAAACALLSSEHHNTSLLVLRQFVQFVFLPLAAALSDARSTARAAQELQQLADLLAAKQAWQVINEVLQCAHDSLQLQQQQPAGCQPASLQRVQVQLPPTTACATIKQLVSAALQAAEAQQQQEGLQAVLELAAGPLLSTARSLLCCQDSSMRQAAFQQLLPVLLQAAAAVGPAQHEACLQQLLQQCLDMLSQPVVPRRLGLAVLLQYWVDWQLQPPCAPDSADAGAAVTANSSTSNSQRFWGLLRECLVDPEALNRKRAFRLLQLLLPKAQLQSQPQWGVLLALYELLEEFTPHLVKATWPQVAQLHPPAAAYAAEDPAADVASSKKLDPLSRGKQQLGSHRERVVPMPFCWSSIVWTRALQHKNLQVQRMAMKTLLKRDWSPHMLQQVPVSFITQVLLPALLSSLHHNSTQTAGTLSPSGAVLEQQQGCDSFDVTQQAGELLSSWVACAEPAAARQMLSDGVQAAAATGQDLSRSGLKAVLKVLAAAAGQARGGGAGRGLLQDMSAVEAEAYADASLQHLHLLLTRFLPWHGSSYKATCCALLINIAAATAPPGSCSLRTCARLLQDMQLPMLGPGGELNTAVRDWLTSGSSESANSAGSSCSGIEWLTEGASSLWQEYLTGGRSNSSASSGSSAAPSQQCATQPEYALWHVASDAWLRVATCCGTELQQQLESAGAELASWTEQISSRPYLPVGLPDRVLIMAAQLAETAEVALRTAEHSSSCQSQQGQLPVITQAALQFAAGAGGVALAQLLRAHCCCFYTNPSELAGTQSGAEPGAAAGLSPAAWQAAARAEMTARAASAAAVLMARCLEAVQSSTTLALPNSLSSQQVLSSLLQLLRQLADAGQALAAKPLPTVDGGKTSGHTTIDSPVTAAAVAAEQSRAAYVKVLRHLSLGLSRSLHSLPPQSSGLSSQSLPMQPASWINALLREVAAAAEAHKHWEPVLAGSRTVGDLSAGWIKGIDWPCLDACMALAGALSTTRQQQQQQQRAQSALGDRLPVGVLQQGVLVSLLVQALDALQWTAASNLSHLLRCVRRVWALAVQDSSLQAAALQALETSGHLVTSAAAGRSGDSADNSSSHNPLPSLAASLSHSLLQALHGSKKRPMLQCGALVNTLMLPELMVCDTQQQPHLLPLHSGPEAPFRRFIGSLLQEGGLGSRTLHLVVALRLASCIPDAPQLLCWYAAELKQLLLWSGGALEAGLEPKSALAHEAATEWSLLVEDLEPRLATAGIMAGIGPRIAVVAALHQLAAAAGLLDDSTPDHQRQQQQVAGGVDLPSCNGGVTSSSSKASARAVKEPAFTAQAVAAGAGLWNSWMQATLDDPILSSQNFKQGSEAHRSKVRMWQGLSATVAFLGCGTQQEAATQACKDLLTALQATNPASVKQYQEGALTYLLLHHQHLIRGLLLPQLTDLEKGGPDTASHILVAVRCCINSREPGQLLPELALLLLPWTNHHTHNIRVFAQLGMCALQEVHPLDSWPAWQQGLRAGGVVALRSLQHFYDTNADFCRFRRSMGSGMLSWSAASVVTPAGIFCSSLACGAGSAGSEEAAGASVTFEGCRQSLLDTVLHFLSEERAKLREAAADKEAAMAATAGGGGGGAHDSGSGSNSAGLQLDYQRKVTPSERAVLLADVLDDVYEAEQGGGPSSAPAGTRRHDLVVVASLIDKVPNLAGLARTAEVLGAGTLVLSDLRVANDTLFTSISVTAERWVPLLEVKEAALLGWLQQQKAAGYSLVGLEQTAESTQLPSYAFPTKTVLVLGREKEGIPPEIIAMLDATVEIPQLGVIRSLNVHVSGAIAMYEFCKQQLRGA